MRYSASQTITAIVAGIGTFLFLQRPWMVDHLGELGTQCFFIGIGGVLYFSLVRFARPADLKHGVEAIQAWGAACIYGALGVAVMVGLSELSRRLLHPQTPWRPEADRGFALVILFGAAVGALVWAAAWAVQRGAREPRRL